MPKVISTAKFVALLSLRVDLGRPRRIPDPLPKAKEIVISDWPGKNAQLLLRLIRGLAGSYTKGQWQRVAGQIEKAVKTLALDQCP